MGKEKQRAMNDDKDEPANNHPRTLQSIADELGITRQAVAEIEKRALMKCRKILRRMRLINKNDILPD